MTTDDSEKSALAAGLVTDTLSAAETLEAERLLAIDPDFARQVEVFRREYEAERDNPVPERVWHAIERRLTGRQN